MYVNHLVLVQGHCFSECFIRCEGVSASVDNGKKRAWQAWHVDKEA